MKELNRNLFLMPESGKKLQNFTVKRYMKMPKKESGTILVVDDDPFILCLVEEQLTFFGYKPIVASTAQEALKLAGKKKRIDLLLTDIIMPEMDGFDLARQFAALYPETRILFMSGDILPSFTEQKIFDAEYNFLQKPFGVDTLISKVKNLLRRPAAQAIEKPEP